MCMWEWVVDILNVFYFKYVFVFFFDGTVFIF